MKKTTKMALGGLVFLLTFGNTSAVWAAEPATKPAVPVAMPASIHVELKEADGRRVEGNVRGHSLAVDQPKAYGAADTAPTPPETLAFALGACVVSTARYLAILEKLDLRHITAHVDGTLDYARASGVPTSARAGYSGLKVTVAWESSLDVKTQQSLLQRVLERCPMCDNLANPTPIELQLAPQP